MKVRPGKRVIANPPSEKPRPSPPAAQAGFDPDIASRALDKQGPQATRAIDAAAASAAAAACSALIGTLRRWPPSGDDVLGRLASRAEAVAQQLTAAPAELQVDLHKTIRAHRGEVARSDGSDRARVHALAALDAITGPPWFDTDWFAADHGASKDGAGDPAQNLWARGGPLEKLDLVASGRGQPATAQAAERASMYGPQQTDDWAGNCNAASYAGLFFVAPRHDVEVDGVVFTKRDIGGLLTVIAREQAGLREAVTALHGERTEGTDAPRIHPRELLAALEDIGERGGGFANVGAGEGIILNRPFTSYAIRDQHTDADGHEWTTLDISYGDRTRTHRFFTNGEAYGYDPSGDPPPDYLIGANAELPWPSAVDADSALIWSIYAKSLS